MTYFVWSNNLSTGHDRIDEDHRKLVNLINTFHKAIEEGRGQALMGRALDALIVYYKVHFDREEAEMLRIAYPKYLAHKLEHDKFMDQVDQLKKNFDKGVALNPAFVGRMLSDWLRDHIARVDTQLAHALQHDK